MHAIRAAAVLAGPDHRTEHESEQPAQAQGREQVDDVALSAERMLDPHGEQDDQEHQRGGLSYRSYPRYARPIPIGPFTALSGGEAAAGARERGARPVSEAQGARSARGGFEGLRQAGRAHPIHACRLRRGAGRRARHDHSVAERVEVAHVGARLCGCAWQSHVGIKVAQPRVDELASGSALRSVDHQGGRHGVRATRAVRSSVLIRVNCPDERQRGGRKRRAY